MSVCRNKIKDDGDDECSWLDLQALMDSSRILNINPYEQVRKKTKNIYPRGYIFGPKMGKKKRGKTSF